ncbi:hypothetical protein IAE33_002450 [Pseudomonas sp. S60]|uniref:hypothetical protein n=1 Tax=Pseudomonas sp. S60 TaxID=211124 RepID=UPI0019131B72|nr:hypothetical protein [Pseudomonas sp. S60]MBK5010590.1 hypothetical protein [Pseudomonas sp. S60]
MGYTKSPIGLKSYDWSSMTLLADLNTKAITGCKKTIEARREHFWHDMNSEFDSKHFLLYLMRRSDLTLSDDFLEFACLWHLDEQNHYRGLRKINSVLYGIPESKIDEFVASRQPDFTSIDQFLIDEFSILLSIAFDEVTSTRAYRQDFPLFDSLGPRCLSVWVRNAAKDEAAHYGNAIRLLKLSHRRRFNELPALLDRIVNFETAKDFAYHSTFLFDHDTDDFSQALLASSRCAILDTLRSDL